MRSGYDLGARLTGCDGGIDERPREEGFFASLSTPFSGKTEVTRGSWIRLARHPSRTPISIGRSVPRFGGSEPCIVEVEQQFHFGFFDKWLRSLVDLTF
jgi:hypothetical protein